MSLLKKNPKQRHYCRYIHFDKILTFYDSNVAVLISDRKFKFENILRDMFLIIYKVTYF